ncbi:osmotically inducible protein C [Marinithermofilum abyssi]|uniref:Osmotically inducible protein C n=1 Tax=Marinithermofilum abyssi TaxID=1571185 RepID=A0A8J2VKB0_9BACL|nr:OsmC family protein [Marinithermofilum abyssi]GGE27923.1 osmotically inducible protein C [Marinithermofilum abyssi]
MAKQIMNVAVQSESRRMRTLVETNKHQFIVDEPANMGGTDQGANPLEYLLGSLVGCENVIANFVAKEMNFQLDGIRFQVEGELDSRGLMGDPEVKPYFQKVQIQAQVETSESEERVQELQKVVDQRCPVFTLMKAAGVELEVEWKKA